MWSRLIVVIAVLLGAACSRSHDPPPAPKRVSAPEPLTCRTLESCTDACSDGACAEACVRRLTAAARPAYEALQACVKPACASGNDAPCLTPSTLACKMCVLAHCAGQAATCMKS